MEIISDFNTSVEKALAELDPKYKKYKGLVICGTHDPSKAEKQIQIIKLARENNIPTLGICWGLQLMLVEYARNVFSRKDANSEEMGAGENLIIKLPGYIVGGKMVHYQGLSSIESHWHQYAFDVNYDDMFNGPWELNYSNFILEYAKLKSHPFYMGVQFHPEYQSTKMAPHRVFLQFLNAARNAN